MTLAGTSTWRLHGFCDIDLLAVGGIENYQLPDLAPTAPVIDRRGGKAGVHIYFGARLRFGAVLPGHVGWGEKVREVVAVSVVVESSLQDIAWKRRASRNQF